MSDPDATVTCSRCGHRNYPDDRFCGTCGRLLESGSAPAPTVAPATAADGERTGGGCLGCAVTGCLVVLAAVVLVAAIVAALYFKLPQRAGIVKSPAQTLLSGTPDREAARAILAELKSGGVETKGVDLYVLPISGTDGSLVYVVLDASKGFVFPSAGKADPLLDVLGRTAVGPAAREAGVRRVAVEYRGKDGEKLIVLTGSADAISAFQQGRISRADFLRQLEGDANWPAFYREVLGQ